MSVDPLPKLPEKINLLTGIIFKNVFFLDEELTKFCIVGFFKERDYSAGVVFKGRKGHVYWSDNTFLELSEKFELVKEHMSSNKRLHIKGGGKEDIKVMRVFGRHHAFVFDGEHTLTLNCNEWNELINTLPDIRSYFELLRNNRQFLIRVLDNGCSS